MASSERFSGLRSVRAPEEIVCRLTVEGPPRDYVGVVTALPVRKFNAFTTSELVVVLAIVSAITVLVLPGFNASREKERRVRCSRGLHILSVSAQLYATDHRDLLYNNLPESGFWDTQCLPPRTYALMTNGIDPRSVDCPGLYPFTIPGLVEKPGGRLRKGGGVLIGYNYLGGITNLPEDARWISPLKQTGDPETALFTDPNNYGDEDRPWVIAPHRVVGPARLRGSTFLWLDLFVFPREIGAEGGNVVRLDGACSWRPIDKMDGEHRINQRDMFSRGFW